MSPTPRFLTARPDQVHHIQARLAFLTDKAATRPAVLRSVDAERVELCGLDGTDIAVRVHQPDRLAEVLGRGDLCRLHGEPLVMVNQRYRVLAVATGPASPPPSVVVLLVSQLDDDGGVVELLSADDDQPSWQLFALHPRTGS